MMQCEVHEGKESDDSNSSASDVDEFELCHVCKIEIPRAYVPDHVGSTIHKTNVRIAKIALERARENIDNFKKWQKCAVQPTDAFCDVCNEVYNYLEYSVHEGTEKHRRLIVYEKLLPRMYELYKDIGKNFHLIDEIDEVFKRYISTAGKTKQAASIFKVQAGKTYCEVCDVYKHTAGFSGHLIGKKHRKNCTDINLPITKVKAEQKYCDICSVFKSASNFDAHLNSKKHIKKANKLGIDIENDKFEPFNLDKIRVLIEDHAKYIDAGPAHLNRCKVCDVYIRSPETDTTHIESEEHFKTYKLLLCINNITKIGHYYYCPKCDVIISDIIEHVKSKHGQSSSLSDYYCELCQTRVPSSGKDTHEIGAKHRQNKKIKLCEDIKYIDLEISDNIDRKALTLVNDKLTCTICKIPLEDYGICHFNGSQHKSEFDKYVKCNGIEVEDESYFCTKCDVVVVSNDILEHVKSYEHTWNHSGHLNGKKHRKNCTDINLPITKVKAEQKYCDICSVFKSASNFDAHLNSKKHIKKANKLGIDIENDKFEPFNLDKIRVLIKDHAKYIDAGPAYLNRCKVCDVYIRSPETDTTHIESEEHFKTYKLLLCINNITKIGHYYYCPKCDVIISDIIEHVKSKHGQRSSLSDYYCELCQTRVPSSGKYTHEIGAKHGRNKKIKLCEDIKYIDLEISDNIDRKALTLVNDKLTCTICKIPLEDYGICHFNGSQHKSEFDKYVKCNGIEVEDESYFCTKCDVVVVSNDILEHVKSYEHTWNQNRA